MTFAYLKFIQLRDTLFAILKGDNSTKRAHMDAGWWKVLIEPVLRILLAKNITITAYNINIDVFLIHMFIWHLIFLTFYYRTT